MTTKEHVYELVDRIDGGGLDVERLDDQQLSALEVELSSILLRFGRREGSDSTAEGPADDQGARRPYDPLGAVRNLVGARDYDGPTDVSVDKYRHVADAIDPE